MAMVLGWAYSLAHFALTGVRQSFLIFTSDFLAAFPSWKVASLMGRLDMYSGSLAEEWGPRPLWLYGPVLHLITLPLFAFSDLRTAFNFWLFVNYAFVAGILVLSMRMLGDGRITFAKLSFVVFITLNFNPFYEALTIRAIEVFELLLLLGAYVLHRKGYRATSGALIGIAAMAKFLPLIYLPYFVLKRNWRAFFASLAVIVPVAAATELLFGWKNSHVLLQLRNGGFLVAEENQSLSGMILRLLQWTHSPLSGAILSAIAITLALAAFSLLSLRIRTCNAAEDLQWWMLAAVMILVPPHNQNYYAIFLLPAYLVLAYQYFQEGWSRRAAMTLVSFLIVGLPVPLSVLSRITGVAIFPLYLHAGLGFVGAALLTGVLTVELLRQCSAPLEYYSPERFAVHD